MSTISAGTTTTTALVNTGDTTGNLVFQTNGTTNALSLNTSGAAGFGSSPNYGTAGQALVSAGSGAAPTWGSALVSGTLQTVTSGTAVNFTGIPSWVKRITVNISGLSGAASLSAGVQLGTGGLVTSGYTTGQVAPPGATYTAITDKIVTFGTSAAASTISGIAVITYLGSNIWSATSMMNRTTDNLIMISAGTITLSGTLDQVSVVTTSSSFDAGSVNILYE
jgi:hypothetical protein